MDRSSAGAGAVHRVVCRGGRRHRRPML